MAQPPRNIGMKQTIDPRIAANVTQRIVEAMTESLCASTPMLSWHGPRTDGDGMISAGGSAFLIRTQSGVFGVTAGHVVAPTRFISRVPHAFKADQRWVRCNRLKQVRPQQAVAPFGDAAIVILLARLLPSRC